MKEITLFATDLFPYSYTISVNGIEVETINSDTNGILKSIITLSSGNHTIEINQNPLNNQNFVVWFKWCNNFSKSYWK